MSLFSFGSNRRLHGRHQNNDNLWGAWYSGLQTVALMPPQIPPVTNNAESNKIIDSQQNKLQRGREDMESESDIQTCGTNGHFARQQNPQVTSLSGNINSSSSAYKMRGARPKSSNYMQPINALSNSSNSTPFRSSTSAGAVVVQGDSPSRTRGKSCDRLDSGRVTPSETHPRSRQRFPKLAAHSDSIWTDMSMSFDSTGTEETTSSSGGAEIRSYLPSSHRILPTRQHQSFAKRQQMPDAGIFNEFLEERLDSGISGSPKDDSTINEKSQSPYSQEGTIFQDKGSEESSIDVKDNRGLGRRGRLQRSMRVAEEEITPRKKSKSLSKETESLELDTEEDERKLPKCFNNTSNTSLSDRHNTNYHDEEEQKNSLCVSSASFDGLDNDEEDVAYIDDDIDERDLHSDLLNWLTLSDAPRQGQDENDL